MSFDKRRVEKILRHGREKEMKNVAYKWGRIMYVHNTTLIYVCYVQPSRNEYKYKYVRIFI